VIEVLEGMAAAVGETSRILEATVRLTVEV
jgi:hypothetical protein